MIDRVQCLLVAACFLFAPACSRPPEPASYEGAKLYEGAMVWNGMEFRPADFVVKDGIFIERPRAIPSTVDRIDLSGRFVVPPFGDGHTHKIEGAWSIAQFNDQFLRQGVYYAQNPAGLPRLMKQARELTTKPETIDVAYAMGGLTTPFGHPERGYIEFMTQYAYRGETRESLRGTAIHAVKTEEDVRNAIDILVQDQADFVKVFLEFSEEFEERSARLEAAGDDLEATGIESSTGMNPALLPAVIRYAQAVNLPVKAHVTSAYDFRTAVESEVDEILHMPGTFLHGKTAIEPFELTTDDARMAAQADIAVVATAAVRLGMIEEKDRERVYDLHVRNVRTLLDNGVSVLIGIDNYGETTRTEVDHLRSVGAMTDRELLTAWIATGQRIFPERKIGKIGPGYEASFLVLDADPLKDFSTLDRILYCVKEGQMIELTDNPDGP